MPHLCWCRAVYEAHCARSTTPMRAELVRAFGEVLRVIWSGSKYVRSRVVLTVFQVAVLAAQHK